MEYYKQEENYKIVGIYIEVHRILGPGLLEIVYKDALEMNSNSTTFLMNVKKNFPLNIKEIFFHINFMLILLFTMK